MTDITDLKACLKTLSLTTYFILVPSTDNITAKTGLTVSLYFGA